MWEHRYSTADDYLFGTAPAAFLRENPSWLRPGARGLCVADGEGRNSVYMAGAGLDITAFDLSETAVERANKLAKQQGVSARFNVSNWDSWNWNAPAYDLVAAIFIQFVGPVERSKQFANIKTAVKPGGVLLLHGYRPEQIDLGTGGPPRAENMYTEEMLRHEFSNWQIERLASYERDVQEGRGHSGKSALIDLIARKPA
ncbi:MAG: class I SAM-dependent methyltransferase [Paracoccaceae bacterium]